MTKLNVITAALGLLMAGAAIPAHAMDMDDHGMKGEMKSDKMMHSDRMMKEDGMMDSDQMEDDGMDGDGMMKKDEMNSDHHMDQKKMNH